MSARPSSVPLVPMTWFSSVTNGRHTATRVKNRWCRFVSLFPFLILLFASTTSAQYHFDVWTSDNGLPQNGVYSIVQTPDGYLWFTTLDGLVRYDGVRFTVFNKSNTEGLNSNRFIKLFVDSEGTLWAGTEGGDITRFHQGKFTSFATVEGNAFNEVFSIQQEIDGSVLISTRRALFHWRAGSLTKDSSERSGIVDKRVLVSATGARWSLDKTGRLDRLKDGIANVWSIPAPPNLEYTQMYEDSRGQLWIAMRDVGLCKFREGDLSVFTKKDGMPLKLFWSLGEDSHGNIWAGGQTALVRYRDGTFTTFTKEQGLSSNEIRAIFVDREGTLWLGTNDRGIIRVNRQAISVMSKGQGLQGTNVYAILEDSAGDFWTGAYPGLAKISNGNYFNFIPDLNVGALGEDREGNLWFGADGRVALFKNGKVIERSDSFALPPKTYSLQVINQDNSGAIWFGLTVGLARFKDGNYQTFTTKDGLPGDNIKAIAEDRHGGLWIATSSGLGHFKDGRFSSFTTQHGLPSNHVRSLYLDRDGILWVGTYDGGLARHKDGRLVAISTKHGLFNDGVFHILEDQFGFLWMSSNRGIYRASRQQLNDFADGRINVVDCTAFGKPDGMLNVECNGGHQPAGIKARDGKLLFATQDGVAIVDPELARPNTLHPPVIVEECVIDRNPAVVHGGIELAPGQSYLDIHYTALSFIKSDQVRFKYKLEGLDTDWVEAGTRRVAFYSYLPPGSYTFKVIAANSDGVWNTGGASVEVRVIPPFYRRLWLQGIAGLAVVGGMLLLYRRRVAAWKRAKAVQEGFSRRLLESQESDRQRIAAELHDSLGQSLAIIKNRALFGLNAPMNVEQAREQFDQIASHSTQAIDEVKEIAYNLRPYLLDRLGLTKAIESMLNKVADSSEISISTDVDQIDNLFTSEQEINFYRIIQESISNIIKHSEASEAFVLIKKESTHLNIAIQDSGKGFTQESTDANESRKGGFGLIGLAERARTLGGKPVIDSAPGRGTTIKLRLPIGNASKGGEP